MSTHSSGPNNRAPCCPPPDPSAARHARARELLISSIPGHPSRRSPRMSKSPGHQKWPEHKVLESPVGNRVTVEVNGQILADSSNVIRVDEDGSPARYYFPRSDVSMDKLQRTATTSQCPFKGTAHYFSLATD